MSTILRSKCVAFFDAIRGRSFALAGDKRANFALTTAICAVPMFGIIGLSIDYAILLSNKAKLDAAADAASIAAVTTAKAVLKGGGTLAAAKSAGRSQGLASFASNSSNIAFPSSANPITPKVNWGNSTGQSLNVTVSYSAPINSQFGRFFNNTANSISGSSSSNAILVPFYQFIFVVDISGSMSIGGTPGDITGLQNDRNIQCAFACHDPNHNRSSTDFRYVAKQDGWNLKIDYVNSAIQSFINDLKSQSKNIPGYFYVGIDTFATNFNVLQAPVLDTSASLISSASSIDVEPMMPYSVNSNGYINQGYTTTTASLQAALANVNNIGDGSSSSSQATYFIFLSDGIEDIDASTNNDPNVIYGRYSDVSYTSACTSVKQAKATMITIEAPYPQVSDNQYPLLVAPFTAPKSPNMQSAMQVCASDPSWAFQATDGPGINSAVSAVLQKILQGLTRISN